MTLDPGGRDRLRAQLGRWREDLIDLSRRNRLLWFRPTRATTFELRQPGLRDIHQRTMAGESWGFFLPPDPAAPRSDQPPSEPRADELVTDKSDPATIRRGLLGLERRTTQTFMDAGLWVLYLGIGMLRWHGPDETEEAHSPLLLVPVLVERPSLREPFRLRRTEGDLVINPALAVKLQTDFGVTLPALDEPDDADADTVFSAVRAACSKWRDWVIEERVVLATFSFQKEAMYRDLLDNEEAILAGPTVRALGLGREHSAPFAFSPIAEGQLDEIAPPERLVSILDADSTQRQCINAAVDGRSFVMDGPPGTGKSQTIANLIAELVSRGQTVLFVSEKAAALDVVQSRLTAAGLGEFLLAIHSHKATRKEVAVELGRALASQPMPGRRMGEDALDRLRQRRLALTGYVEAMNEPRQPLGWSLHQAYGSIALNHALPRVAWWSGSADQLDMSRMNEILESAAGLARAWGPVERGGDFLWRDLAFDRSDMHLVHRIRGEVDACQGAVASLRDAAAAAAAQTGLDWADGLARTRDLQAVVSQLVGHPQIPAHWLSRQAPEAVRVLLRDLEADWSDIRSAERELEQLAGPGWRTLAETDHQLLTSALDGCADGGLAWRLSDSLAPDDVGTAVRFADELVKQLPWLEAQAQRLAEAFGAGEVANLRQVQALGELGAMLANQHRPESAWLSPITLPPLQTAAGVLAALVEQYRARRLDLMEVFTDEVLGLDLETLTMRFEQVYRGPFNFLNGAYRSDRRLLAAATRLGKVDGRVRARLRDALEWQRLTSQLRQAERQHAGVIGDRYYQHVDTDFEALTDAVETARRAVELAGSQLDSRRLAGQLAADGSPDPAVLAMGRDVQARMAWLLTEAEAVIPESVRSLLDAPLPDLLGTAARVGAPLRTIVQVLNRVVGVAGRGVTLGEASRVLELRVGAAELEGRRAEREPSDREVLGPAFAAGASDWKALSEALEWSVGLHRLTGDVSEETATRLLSAVIDPQALSERLGAWDRAAAALAERFLPPQAEWLREHLAGRYEVAISLLDGLGSTTGDIDEWLEHLRRRAELGAAGLGSAVEDCLRESVAASDLVTLLQRAVLEGWADRVAQADPRLREMRSQDRDRLVDDFRQLDRELVRLSAARVMERCNELRQVSTVGQAGIIQAQANLKRRHKPIRRLLADAGDVAKRLKPCFVMSPLSVSSFLPADIRFDVVIFDEASQVRPADAINCVYRADRLIVAGDQKQLPPTSFFDSRIQDGDDGEDDEAVVQDFDSILDQCKGAGLPSLSLQWHYRSQHESLIAFSNASFYDRHLLTFPGAIAHAPDLGVELYRVDGTYRGKPHNDNPIEAAKVAERVLNYAEQSTRQQQSLSVGVVTFSDAQEECVLAAIEDLRAHRPDLDRFFRADRLNGFFVKNLESVQGDERDVMIFSIGYAYDTMRRFALRMGPLSADGGERRLNVAVTRARRRVEVVTSVGPEDFRGEMKEGGGVWHLREYLAYVGRGGVLVEAPRSTGRSFDSELEESVARTLESWGYQVEPQVGMARYRVDLGVRRRDDPSRYLLGVECDGAMYHSARVARDRDRLRHLALTSLGWRLHRVWSPAWYRDRHGEEERLRAALPEAESEPPMISPRREPEDGPSPEVRVVEPEPEGPPPWTLPYRVSRPTPPRYRIEMHLPEAGVDIRRMVMEVAEIEAPVAVELALRRVREAWAVGAAGQRIQANFEAQLDQLRRAGRIRLFGGFIWPPTGDLEHVRVPRSGQPETERRVEHVPSQELDIAIMHVAAEAVAVTEDQLTEAVARVFGWRRRGPDIRPALATSVQRFVAAGKLERAGDALRWVGDPLPIRRVRKVTGQVMEPRLQIQPTTQPPAPVPARRAPGRPVRVAPPALAVPQPGEDSAGLPDDLDRCLTVEGHQEVLKDLRLAEGQLQTARQRGDAVEAGLLFAKVDGLQRLLSEARVLPPPPNKETVAIGHRVSFQEEDGPEETWRLVPPLEADAEKGRMSVLTPIGQALFGSGVGDTVDVQAPGGGYPVRIIAIEVA
jgi:transcription elongation GreA/GreB family factor/very-short-patch-repair endonuclease